MRIRPTIVTREEWATDPAEWRGRLEGESIGAGTTVLFFSSERPGAGPKLHVHPYEELFIIRQGRARFTIGEEELEARAGDIVFGPAHVPHKFVNLGPGRLETTDIHLSERWIQTDLE